MYMNYRWGISTEEKKTNTGRDRLWSETERGSSLVSDLLVAMGQRVRSGRRSKSKRRGGKVRNAHHL